MASGTPERLRRLDPSVVIAGFGNAVWDRTAVVARYPEPNTCVSILEQVEGDGGQAGNAIAALARWGARTRFGGRVGDDEPGARLIAGFRREGVDTSHLLAGEGMRTREATILIDRAGDTRTIFCTRDARLPIPAAEAPTAILDGAALLHLDGFHEDAALALAREARRRGIPVMLDANQPRANSAELLPLVDYLITSEEFARTFADVGADNFPGELHNGRALTAVTLGPQGVVAIAGADAHVARVPSFPIEVVDTTGAGDAFHAGAIYGLLAKWPIDATLRFACAAGALACRALGARAGIAPLAEVAELAGIALEG